MPGLLPALDVPRPWEGGGGGTEGGAPGAPAQRQGRVRGRGPELGASAGTQPAAEPSAAGDGIPTSQRAMNSERQSRIPFSIADILGPRTVPGAPSAPQLLESCPDPTSPLCALEELTSKTFRGLDGRAAQPSEGPCLLNKPTAFGLRLPQRRAALCSPPPPPPASSSPEPHLQPSAIWSGRVAPDALGPGPAGRRRRKSRTAFTAQQVLELERRFVFQKYLAPSERDGLAARLGLANAQVVTWFQNRRAKLKRDVEEMRADVASLRTLSPGVLCSLEMPHDFQSPGPNPSPGPCPTGSNSESHLSDEEIQVDD